MKTFLLDTNVLLHDPSCLEVFEDNEVIIPISVLDELDTAKIRMDDVGRNARQVIRFLDNLRLQGSLNQGVKLGKGVVRVELNYKGHLPESLSETVDNRILGTAVGLQKDGKNVILISKDINMRVKCDAMCINSQDYTKDKLAANTDSIYSGKKELMVSSEKIDKLFSDGQIELDIEGYNNQFFKLQSESNPNHVGIARYIGNGIFKTIRQLRDLYSIVPKNLEQRMAIDLLVDPSIKLVTLTGCSGGGKTLIAVAAAMYGVLEAKIYNRVLISRPIQPMGRDIGYLKGGLDEKLRPWMQPIYDNLEFLLGMEYESTNVYEGLIHVEPLTYIRGRSIPKSFFILDEAQNLSMHEIKTIITRVGEDTKIVITGDLNQIDNPYVDFADNGLTHVVEKFKDYEIAGHITFKKGERSELATIASKIL